MTWMRNGCRFFRIIPAKDSSDNRVDDADIACFVEHEDYGKLEACRRSNRSEYKKLYKQTNINEMIYYIVETELQEEFILDIRSC